jgi:hypothetical protein
MVRIDPDASAIRNPTRLASDSLITFGHAPVSKKKAAAFPFTVRGMKML